MSVESQRPFQIGDIVERACGDRQIVLDVEGDTRYFHGGTMKLRCIKADKHNTYAVGDEEWNLCDRYGLISPASEKKNAVTD